MKDLAVVFDFDDTLVYTQDNYSNSKKWVKDKYLPDLSNMEFDNSFVNFEKETLTKALKGDLGDLPHPFHPLRFVRDFYKVLDKYSIIYNEKFIEDKIFSFLSDVVVKENSKKILEELKDVDLFLLTVGDEDWQRDRISRSGFENYFKKMFFVIEKENILKELKKNYLEVIMIGDSLRSDILAGNKAEAITVHLLGDDSWSFLHSDKAEPDYKINNLEEVLKIINKYSFKHS